MIYCSSRLLFCASHTHCGPEIRPDKVPFFHIAPEYAAKIPAYLSWLAERLVALVAEALGELQPARLRACRASAPFAHNRRGSAAVDHDVPVLAVTSPDGRRSSEVEAPGATVGSVAAAWLAEQAAK